MRLFAMLVSSAAILLLGAAAPDLPTVQPADLETYAIDKAWQSRMYPIERIAEWETMLRASLKTMTPQRAADRLATQFDVPAPAMRELVHLWLIAKLKKEDWHPDPTMRAELRKRLLGLLAATRAPVVVQAVAEGLEEIEECSAADFDAILEHATDRSGDAWRVANAATCMDNFSRFIAAAPDRSAAGLLRMADWGPLPRADTLAIYAWLTGPDGQTHIAASDREATLPQLYRSYARLLFEAGLTERGVALIDGLSPELRALTLAPAKRPLRAQIDGLPLDTDDRDRGDGRLPAHLAAGYAVNGQRAKAEAMLARLPELELAKRTFDCQWSASQPTAKCARERYEVDFSRLLVDWYLHRLGEDPYPISETLFSDGIQPSSLSGPVAEIVCRIFDKESSSPCHELREGLRYRATASNGADAAEIVTARAAIAGLKIPDLPAMTTVFARALTALHGEPTNSTMPTRVAVIPDPPFTATPLPKAYLGARPAPVAWPSALAKLPSGHFPIRFERTGSTVTALSVSQDYDPSGEVIRGGYWVHLSQDGGKSWSRNLYTGLAEHFPYVAVAQSRMPLRDGQDLTIEVEIAELDTSSITYPPVALRTRRRASGLYVRIPLAELGRDSDGDGITDIVSRHLLLDSRGEGGTPFIVGSDNQSRCPASGSAERTALPDLLEKLFSEDTGAIFEPVDRPHDAPLTLGGRERYPAGNRRPILIRGDPADYTCLRPNRLMIVYGAKDLERIARFTPDFSPIEVPPIIYNRARDRGYVRWSAGWAGGTYRLRRVGGAWTFESISSWIT